MQELTRSIQERKRAWVGNTGTSSVHEVGVYERDTGVVWEGRNKKRVRGADLKKKNGKRACGEVKQEACVR